jgi:enoyl-[acyl-carrier-protein] reductase (NADH)
VEDGVRDRRLSWHRPGDCRQARRQRHQKDRDQLSLERRAADDTAKKLKDRGSEAILVKGDIGKPEEVKRMFAKIKSDFGGSLDIFVHSARPNPGAWLAAPMEATPEGLHQAFDSASVAMTVACQECVPLMPNGGRIIGVTYAPGSRTGSWQVWIAMGGGKAAMESTIRYFAVALARKESR